MKTIGMWFVGLALTMASAGCGDGSAGSSSAGSCSTPTTGTVTQCVDYGGSYTASAVMQSCSANNSSYSSSACPSVNRVARCTITVSVGSANAVSTLNFYPPNTAADEMTSCNAMNTKGVTVTFQAN